MTTDQIALCQLLANISLAAVGVWYTIETRYMRIAASEQLAELRAEGKRAQDRLADEVAPEFVLKSMQQNAGITGMLVYLTNTGGAVRNVSVASASDEITATPDQYLATNENLRLTFTKIVGVAANVAFSITFTDRLRNTRTQSFTITATGHLSGPF